MNTKAYLLLAALLLALLLVACSDGGDSTGPVNDPSSSSTDPSGGSSSSTDGAADSTATSSSSATMPAPDTTAKLCEISTGDADDSPLGGKNLCVSNMPEGYCATADGTVNDACEGENIDYTDMLPDPKADPCEVSFEEDEGTVTICVTNMPSTMCSLMGGTPNNNCQGIERDYVTMMTGEDEDGNSSSSGGDGSGVPEMPAPDPDAGICQGPADEKGVVMCVSNMPESVCTMMGGTVNNECDGTKVDYADMGEAT
jgi:hypothetical protein